MSEVDAAYRGKVAVWKRIEGIVRHYHVPNSDHCPYTGVLKTKEDKDSNINLSQLLDDFPDGEHIMITIEGCGKHKNAEGYIWLLTKPNNYERVPIVCKDCKTIDKCQHTPVDEVDCKTDGIPLHVHLAYFGSELACERCNPNCHQNHGMDKPFFCGDKKCPMNPERK